MKIIKLVLKSNLFYLLVIIAFHFSHVELSFASYDKSMDQFFSEVVISERCLKYEDREYAWEYDADTQTLCVYGAISNILDYAFYDDFFAPLEVKYLVLNSRGGHISGAKKVAETVRRRDITTIVPKGAICNSACVLVFAAGKKRYLHPNSKLGVHFVWELQINDFKGPISPDTIVINNLLTKTEYLGSIKEWTGVDLYEPYIEEMLSRGFISKEHVDQDKWAQPYILESTGKPFSRENLWYPDYHWLLAEGLIHNSGSH